VFYVTLFVLLFFGHCIVWPSSIYDLWLPLRYLQTFFFDTKINKIKSSSKKHTVEKNGFPRLANVILVSMKLNLDSKSNFWYPKFLIIDSLLIVNLEDTLHGVFGDKCFEMWLIRGIIFVFVNLKAEKTWFVFWYRVYRHC
jgi:hypothetical protein